MSDYLMRTYARLPVRFVRGAGPWLWDEQDRRYLDAISGIAVCGLGHAHPAVTEALCTQASRLVHTSNLYGVPQQEALGEALARATGMQRAFFCNSGAEANEAALKLARLHGHRRDIERPAVVVAEGSFHGRTLATLSATGNRRVQAGFEPLVPGFVRVPYGDTDALQQVARNSPEIAAVLLEPVQGEGGVRIPPADYLAAVRTLCDAQGWLLMLDEVQSGMARSGRFLASQHAGVAADVVTLAKGLANGVPIGACLARGAAAELFQPGNHASTFGGNPLACAAALAVLRIVDEQHLDRRAAALGTRLLGALRQGLAGLAGVIEVRGLGLMLGIELDRPCGELVRTALDTGLLVNVTAERVLRLLPPLVLSDAEADELAERVIALVRGFLS